MPYFYRFHSEHIRRTLDYRDAVVTLEIVQKPSAVVGHDWVLQARKIGHPGAPCEIYRLCLARQIFDHQLFQQGFSVPDHTPAAKIMARLVREGHAERIHRRS